jgi:polar amino acid transport system substrate-binding protein
MERGNDMKRLVILAGLAFILMAGVSQADTLKIAALDREPYAGQTLTNYGFDSEIVTEAFKRTGHQVMIEFMPGDKAIADAAKGEYDAVFPEYYSQERAEDFVYSYFLSNSMLVFYKRTSSNITYRTLKDLTSYKIGLVKGYTNTDELDNATYLKKIEAESDEENLHKLAKGELDLIVVDRLTAQYLIKTKVPEAAGKLEAIEPPLAIHELFVIFPKKLPASEKLVKEFNKAYESMEKDGTIKAIMARTGLAR